MKPNDIIGNWEEILKELPPPKAPTELASIRCKKQDKSSSVQDDDQSPKVGQVDLDCDNEIYFQRTRAPQPASQFTSKNTSYFSYANEKGRELSSQELGQLLTNNLEGFVLGVLMGAYHYAVAQGVSDDAQFIRTDVQRFVIQNGRHKFRSVPYGSIQNFIDECVTSGDVLNDEEYIFEKMMRDRYDNSGTVDLLIKKANNYLRGNAHRETPPDDDKDKFEED